MKKFIVLAVTLLLCLVIPMGCGSEKEQSVFVTIGTGGITGVYYPTGGAIAKMVNAKRKDYGIRATVESTGGSVFNINAILAGDLEFGVAQSDRQYQAVKGIAVQRRPRTHCRRPNRGSAPGEVHEASGRDGGRPRNRRWA